MLTWTPLGSVLVSTSAGELAPRPGASMTPSRVTNSVTISSAIVIADASGRVGAANYQADVEARTIGASAHRPVLFDGRWPDTDVLWNVPSIKRYPFTGSATYYWDTGPVREEPLGSGTLVGGPCFAIGFSGP